MTTPPTALYSPADVGRDRRVGRSAVDEIPLDGPIIRLLDGELVATQR